MAVGDVARRSPAGPGVRPPSPDLEPPLRHVIEAQQFSPDLLERIFERAEGMRRHPGRFAGRLRGRIMAALFYEPSTRTRLSFEAAMLRLGGQTIGTDNAREFSSAAKGETLEDTIRVVAGYADVIVLRHPEEGAAARAAAVSDVPLINAGDGKGQHPTQALLDLYTIQRELGRLDGIRVAMVGDLANGRTVHSLAYLLSRYRGVRMWFVAPPEVAMRPEVKAHLDGLGVPWAETQDLEAVLPEVDVVYQTRIQRERFADPASYPALEGRYVIGPTQMGRLGPRAIVMHPLPRLNEIDPAVDPDPRAAYFRQARNGVQIRMALLDMVLS
ncbi:MAG TPA: aspartate carbamoyltransferase [Candidatus Dormibacteraeota bacterium]|nr:aspartate carbamoyltransferase [Candidatus Dormibacteraeota bacterium]